MRMNDAFMHFLCSIEDKVSLDSTFSIAHSTHWDKDAEAHIPEIVLSVWANYVYPDEDSWEAKYTGEEVLAKNQLAYRFIKKSFGPFSAEGEAPNVYLKGSRMVDTELGKYHVSVTVYGAYRCEIVEEKEVPVNEAEAKKNRERAAALEREADALRTKTSTSEKSWRCVAATSAKL